MWEIVVATVKFGSGQAAALICAAVSVKIMALTIGPAGVGLFSLIRQAQQTLASLATLGGQNAVIQGVASRSGADRDRFISSVFRAFVISASTLGALAVIFASTLAKLVFRTDVIDAPLLVRWIAFPVVAGAMLVFFRSLLNARMQIGSVAWTNVVTAASSIVLVYPAVVAYQRGHEVALVLLLGGSLSIGLLYAIYQASARGCLAPLRQASAATFDKASIRHFLWVGLPSLTALFIGMSSVLVVRALIVGWHGLPAAGQFDSAWSISMLYLTVFLTAMHSYLLPALSADLTHEAGQAVLGRALRLAIIVSVPLISVLIVFKPLVVRLLYSGEFLPALDLLRWTLLGDYLRVAGWVLATTLVARADMRAYLVCEIAWNTVFVGGAYWLARESIAGAGPAYLAAYSVYVVALAIRARRTQRISLPAGLLALWAAGACVVLVVSISAWTDSQVVWSKATLILAAALMSWLAVTPAERHFLRDRLVQIWNR